MKFLIALLRKYGTILSKLNVARLISGISTVNGLDFVSRIMQICIPTVGIHICIIHYFCILQNV